MEQPTTVLVVDDEENIVDLMRDFLEAEGYAVLTAVGGSGALKTLARADRLHAVGRDDARPVRLRGAAPTA